MEVSQDPGIMLPANDNTSQPAATSSGQLDTPSQKLELINPPPRRWPRLTKAIVTTVKVVLAVELTRFASDRLRLLVAPRQLWEDVASSGEEDGDGADSQRKEMLSLMVDYLQGDAGPKDFEGVDLEAVSRELQSVNTEELEDLGVHDPATMKSAMRKWAQQMQPPGQRPGPHKPQSQQQQEGDSEESEAVEQLQEAGLRRKQQQQHRRAKQHRRAPAPLRPRRVQQHPAASQPRADADGSSDGEEQGRQQREQQGGVAVAGTGSAATPAAAAPTTPATAPAPADAGSGVANGA